MDEIINIMDKNIRIKTTTGTEVNITCNYVEDKSLEALLLAYLEKDSTAKMAA